MSQSNYLIPPEVTVALNQLPIIQNSLRDISLQLADLNILKSKVDQVKADIWEHDGIDHRLQNTAQTSEDNYSDIQYLKQSNLELRQEVDLLKSIVVRLDTRVLEQESEIIELKSRSMRENVLIHNLEEQDGENLHVRINRLFMQHFNLDVKFVRIHRNSGRPTPGKPRSITGRLVDFGQKELILKAQKVNIDNKIQLPFHVTPQSPPSVNENRKKLFEVSSKYRAEGVNTRVIGNKMIFSKWKYLS
ncbi:hypothetical protein KUTeg_019128 [Tegillarca granosa]|uniref:Uncharacterized protein n=1 Tax=Tegillarca granosa TaxID=220873 RepID=A0ABQ9EFP5_TEGGR|nr:hypothetical protein KUTeg_019128 [Tegillarca granosa]